MREIEFRIWADNKFYDKCLVGNTNNVEDDKWTCPLVWLENKKEWVHCDNGIICQYTGVKDKNGVKIFEGDIINDLDYGYMVCKYINGSFIWQSIKYKLDIKFFSYIPNVEVIGNIYENNDLLEEK